MVLNYIWIAFFLTAFIVAVVRLIFLGDTEVFPAIINSTFDSSKTAFEISLGLTGVLSLWMGIMRIGEQGGVIGIFSRLLSPLFTKLFPEIPKGHPVTGSIFMNLAANMLGLDNAATPLGLKAMEGLQELNPKKDTASNPMIMFLVLNTSGLTLIPISIMVYRAQLGAAQPTDVFCPYSAGDLFFYTCRYYCSKLIPAHQLAEPDYSVIPRWYKPSYCRYYLFLQHAVTSANRYLFYNYSQCILVCHYHRFHSCRHEKEN